MNSDKTDELRIGGARSRVTDSRKSLDRSADYKFSWLMCRLGNLGAMFESVLQGSLFVLSSMS